MLLLTLTLRTLLPLPEPEVVRADLHPTAETCFFGLVDGPSIPGPSLDRLEWIDRACAPILKSSCPRADPDTPELRLSSVQCLAGVLLSEDVPLDRLESTRPFDLYTAAAAGHISVREYHALLIAGLITLHLDRGAGRPQFR
jgi:hypothetical protein